MSTDFKLDVLFSAAMKDAILKVPPAPSSSLN